MKVVDWKTFSAMPIGTLYHEMDMTQPGLPDHTLSLKGATIYRRGNVSFFQGRGEIPPDFEAVDFFYGYPGANTQEQVFSTDDYVSFPFGVGRWALYDYGNLYLVYEEEDRLALVETLTKPAAFFE